MQEQPAKRLPRPFATRSFLAAKVVFAERFQVFGRIVCLFDNDQGDNRFYKLALDPR
jgi:hypothetical protein